MSTFVQSVIFDFNGTLFFDNDKHVKAWGKVSQELRGRPVSTDELLNRLNGVPNKEIIAYFMGGEATPEQVETYSSRKEAYYREFCRQDEGSFHLVAGATELFDELTRLGIPFTIASASIKANIDFFVESFGLDRWIDPDLIVYDDGTVSNKVAMFQKAAALLGATMEGSLVFEDSPSGLRNAVQTGCSRVVLVGPESQRTEPGAAGVVQRIGTFEEFDRTLLKI